MPGRVVHHLKSYVAAEGVGYEAEPIGPCFGRDAVRGYYVDLRAKTRAASAATPELLNPVGLAQLALGEHERYVAGECGPERFLELVDQVAETGVEHDDGFRWSYDVVIAKYGLDAPWYSAMAQGEIASVLVRAHLLSGDPGQARLAEAAIEPLLRRSPDLVVETVHGPALEEAPSRPASLILNGWIFALWGLFDVAIGLGDARARALFDESAAALEQTLPAYDTGGWSLYSLFPHPFADLAKPFYHRLHGDQFEVLGRLTGTPSFAAAAERFRGYEARRVRRAAVAANKMVFVVVDGAVRGPRLLAGARRPSFCDPA